MKFRASFCDPFNPRIIELGGIGESEIIDKFKSIPWRDYLDRMGKASESEIHYSPSLEIENTENRNGVCISAVDDNKGGVEYYIFFKRPKEVTKFFGLTKKMNNNYLTEITGQTGEDAIQCLTALINDEPDYLEQKIK